MRDAPASDAILTRLLDLHPKLMDLVLDRVWRILAALGDPQDRVPPVIHIAGTNGKGSTQAMIRAGLEAAGKTVHAYTSPHLVRFHERIRLAGELIEEPALESLLAECEDANGGEQITFFEITTAAALLAFSRTPADYTLLEVGLGGRLDATNVFPAPALTVITPVSLDHQQFLGDTLAEIAGEKAGILKPGVPCIVGPQHDEALAAIEDRAAQVGAPLLVHGQDWLVRTEHGRMVYQDDRGLRDLDLPRLRGAHQIANGGAAIAALRVLGIEDEPASAALLNAEWPARMQRLDTGPLAALLPAGSELWLDGGHNAAAGEALAGILDDWHAGGRLPVHLVCGMLQSKSAADFLRPLSPRAKQAAMVRIPDADAAFESGDLVDIYRETGGTAWAADSVQAAVRQIAETAMHPCRVLICGSLYLAGAVLAENG